MISDKRPGANLDLMCFWDMFKRAFVSDVIHFAWIVNIWGACRHGEGLDYCSQSKGNGRA